MLAASMGVPPTTPESTLWVQTAADLIALAKETPPEPVIEGLLWVGDVCLIHGWEESFKSTFVFQVAECLARGTCLLRKFHVPKPRSVAILETEMHPQQMGERLTTMLGSDVPPNIMFIPEDNLLRWKRKKTLESKFAFINEWLSKAGTPDVLIIDTANDFFRGEIDPRNEQHAGEFFDHIRALPTRTRIIVRHDRKQHTENVPEMHSNEFIRGSGEWKEDPELILWLKRKDRRTHQVAFDVGKMRYGVKPDAFECWFDAKDFKLTPLPPELAVIEDAGRDVNASELVEAVGLRFGISRATFFNRQERVHNFTIKKEVGRVTYYGINDLARESYPLAKPAKGAG